MAGSDLFGRPFDGCSPLLACISIPGSFNSSNTRKNLAIAIAIDAVNRNMQALQKVEYFLRHRSGNDVASDNDGIDAFVMNVCQHSFERGNISVNVVNGRDSLVDFVHLSDRLHSSHRRTQENHSIVAIPRAMRTI